MRRQNPAGGVIERRVSSSRLLSFRLLGVYRSCILRSSKFPVSNDGSLFSAGRPDSAGRHSFRDANSKLLANTI